MPLKVHEEGFMNCHVVGWRKFLSNQFREKFSPFYYHQIIN